MFRSLEGGLTYVEIFNWVEGGFKRAHEHPDVPAIWEPMDPLLEALRAVAGGWLDHFQ